MNYAVRRFKVIAAKQPSPTLRFNLDGFGKLPPKLRSFVQIQPPRAHADRPGSNSACYMDCLLLLSYVANLLSESDYLCAKQFSINGWNLRGSYGSCTSIFFVEFRSRGRFSTLRTVKNKKIANTCAVPLWGVNFAKLLRCERVLYREMMRQS